MAGPVRHPAEVVSARGRAKQVADHYAWSQDTLQADGDDAQETAGAVTHLFAPLGRARIRRTLRGVPLPPLAIQRSQRRPAARPRRQPVPPYQAEAPALAQAVCETVPRAEYHRKARCPSESGARSRCELETKWRTSAAGRRCAPGP